VRVDGAGLAAVADREYPYLRGELRGHVQDGLTVVDQAVGDVLADAVAALDRPHAFRKSTTCPQHLGVATVAGVLRTRREHVSALVDHLDRRRSLVRVHTDDHCHRIPP
jgi:hypothetical protein